MFGNFTERFVGVKETLKNPLEFRFPKSDFILVLLLPFLLSACTTVMPVQEHYMLRSEYYRSLEEMRKKAEAEKDVLRERIAHLEAQVGREEGKRLQLMDELQRARKEQDRVQKRLDTVLAEYEKNQTAAKETIEELTTSVSRTKEELDATRRELAEVRRKLNAETSVLLTDEVLFPSASARLAKAEREKIAALRQPLEEASAISVVGYTDDLEIKGPRYSSNWALSAARAASVVDYLIRKMGIPPAKVTVVGRAGEHPLVPNDSAEHRARNRRVEIIAVFRTESLEEE
ncbi:MAG: hypothetical protein D6679_00725 [Candidatus Hydrogenedentota bacterium]|nr:MAG: hypothetical protein D6679_00725 [Candidatus Hydrogenedentota bacterium]